MNNCPYKSTQNYCSHKHPGMKSNSKRNLPKCVFNDEIKCPMYLEWLRLRKSLTKLPRAIREELYEGHRR